MQGSSISGDASVAVTAKKGDVTILAGKNIEEKVRPLYRDRFLWEWLFF